MRTETAGSARARALLELLDRVYDLDADDGAWLRGVHHDARALLAPEHGLVTLEVDAAGATGRILHSYRAPSWLDAWWDEFSMSSPLLLRRALELTPVSHAVDLRMAVGERSPSGALGTSGRGRDRARWACSSGPYRDSLVVAALDASGEAMLLLAPRRGVSNGPPSPAQQRELGGLARHLVTARSLRRRVRSGGATHRRDALVDPRGRVPHAEPESRDRALMAVLRASVVARSHGARVPPSDVPRHWRAMVAGRYALLDVFDSEGKRFVVARLDERASPTLDDASLARREREILALLASGRAQELLSHDSGLAHERGR